VTRSFRILAVAVLAVVLALSSAQNAFAVTELAYDDGVSVSGVLPTYGGVRFSLPTGVTSAKLLYIRFDWSITATNELNIYVTGPDHVTLLTPAILNVATGTGVGCPGTWVHSCSGYDVSGLGITVTGDFYVIVQPQAQGTGNPMADAANSGRSFDGANLAGLTNVLTGDWLIRVDIDPITSVAAGAPVGGFMEPVNKLVVFAPYLALFGVIGAVAVFFWKRPDN